MMQTSALTAINLGALQPYLPYIAIGGAAFIFLIAFIVGVAQGFRRTGWGGFLWGGVCAAYAGICLAFEKNNPLTGMISGLGLPAQVVALLSVAAIAVACIFAVLIVFGIISWIVRPGEEEDAQPAPQTPYPANGASPYAPAYHYPPSYSYSPFGETYDDDFEEDEPIKKSAYKVKKGGFDRFLGGIVAVINLAVVLAVLGGVVLTVLNVTPLRAGALKGLYEQPVFQKVFPYVHSYALDFLLIGILMLYVRRGYNVGIVAGLRSLIVAIGRIAAVGLGFWLPFSPYVVEGAPLAVIGQGNSALAKLLSKYIPQALQALCAPLAGVGMGVILTIILMIVVWIISWLLSLAMESTESAGAPQFLDSVFGSIVYFAIGLAVCGLICVGLYGLQYLGVAQTGGLLGEQSNLCKGIFGVCDLYVKPFLEKFAAGLGG